ncbi:MAG TPA: hypothetical protein VFF72_11980, partial [Caldimonas sp.]|nr:hypothetical protein [Caldimonas sp.]
LTDGRYTRVWTPLGENILLADDADGRRLPVEALSRGTREQLFLSLRLALVGSYARRGVELPLVLDDVLVNFDARRAKAAAAVLRDFAAEGHQVLVFTCHEHVWKLFKNLKLPARTLPSHDEAEGATLAYRAPAAETPDEEPEATPLEPAARWRPDNSGLEMMHIENDDVDEEEQEVFAWDTAEDEPEAGEEDEDLSGFEDEPEPPPPRETPPKVTVVRGPTRGGPFDNALWFEPVEDDLDDEDDAEEVDDDPQAGAEDDEEDAFADAGEAEDEDGWDDSDDDDSDDNDSDDDVEAA